MATRLHWYEPASWVPAIKQAQTDDFWIWALILLVIGLLCGYGVFHYLRRARIVEDTPTSRIRSAHQGYVEINGIIHYLTNQPVIAPLTKRECAWYSFTIEKKESSSSSRGSGSDWRTLEKEISERPFECIDESGSCMIDPRGAEIHTVHKDVWYGSSKWPVHGPGHKRSWFSSGDYRYTELRFQDGDPLYAIGTFRTIDPNKANGTIPEEVATVLRLWKQDQDNLLARFDANGDGQIDVGEWEQARQAAEKQVHETRLEQPLRPAINIMLKTDDFRRPYILSTHPQAKLAGKFRLKAIACTLGFIVLGPIASWMIYIRLAG